MPSNTLRIGTFNVNSIRARLSLILDWLTHRQDDLDIICFQELKATHDDFPLSPFEERGYFCAIWGQKAYNGVATCSRNRPLSIQRGFGQKEWDRESRLITTTFPEFTLVNLYAPRGGEPGSQKWRYKLNWYQHLLEFIQNSFSPEQPLAVVGDFNVALTDLDVYSPEELAGAIGTLPEEREAVRRLLDWGLVDIFRHLYPEKQLVTGGDYIGGDIWHNEGMLLDFVMGSPAFCQLITDCYVDLWPRRRRRPTPSDHAPFIVELVCR
ncbi:MAG TPA: exodeoxyribonuclease III [Candidatus Aminicenantes bacterium]|nr:exodeoxyribonuclease III [Candidatus Aminicenantes bacterium]